MFLKIFFLIANHHQCHLFILYGSLASICIWERDRQRQRECICLLQDYSVIKKDFLDIFNKKFLNKNDPRESYILMLSHQGVGLFDSIRRIWRCGLCEGSLSLELGFEVSHLPVSMLGSGWMHLSTTSPAPHLPHLPNTPCHNDKGLNLWN